MPFDIKASDLKYVIKHRASQTSAGYDYIPEMITFNVWSKVYDMINDTTREFKHRQEKNDDEIRKFIVKQAKLEEDFKNLAMKQKREQNLGDEFRALSKAQGIMKNDIDD